MGTWCNCVECIGYASEQGIEKEPIMDEPIREIHDEDIILWPNGAWQHRHMVEPIELENPANYEVIPYGSVRWTCIHEA